MKALFASTRERLSAACVADLKSYGVDPFAKLEPAYPAQTWAKCVRRITRDLYPDAPEIEGQRALALATVDAFASDFFGKAMFALLRIIGSDRSLKRMTQNFRGGSNFVETKVTRVSETPRIDEVWFNDVTGVPGFYWGMLEGGISHSNGSARKVTLERTDGPSAVFAMHS